jgi:phosphate transport system protein
MSRILLREIEKLKARILSVGAEVEEAVRRATEAIQEGDRDLGRKVIEADANIDRAEVEVEEEGLKILALHQPVAIDLRFIVAVLKINNDLERIGDLAVNIAERAVSLAGTEPPPCPVDLGDMADKAKAMLRQSLEALVNFDADIARNVCNADDEIDALNRRMYVGVEKGICERPEVCNAYIHLLDVSHHLERIADHTTNIAQDVIYMLEGEIVRHKSKPQAEGEST